MKLFLQTSSGQPSLVLWDNGVVFEVTYGQMQRLDYGGELRAALKASGRGLEDLSEIIVDIGPGRLGSTRTAVAFANGLAYARRLPVVPLNSILMLGAYAEAMHAKPCLVLRSAARSQYHWGLVQNGRIIEAGFAPDAVIETSYNGPVVVAGDATPAQATVANAEWLDLNAVSGAALAQLAPQLHPAQGLVVPLTDTNGLADA
jgi:tRNA A37 threonylcarbamoyladenosine modification protein TsaB